MNVGEVIREEAAKVGVTLTDEEVEHVLWEHTGYPCFWPIDELHPTPADAFRKQVIEWADSLKEKR